MSQKSDPNRAAWIISAIFIGWLTYQYFTGVSDIKRAEFRVLYAGARDRLDAFSRCRFTVGKPIEPARLEAQIEFQQKFSVLRNRISGSRFSSDQKLLDLEIQLKDQNPQTDREDDAARCKRLSPFASTGKPELGVALSDVENFLEKY